VYTLRSSVLICTFARARAAERVDTFGHSKYTLLCVHMIKNAQRIAGDFLASNSSHSLVNSSVCRIDKCKRGSSKRLNSGKETYDFNDPANRSHYIASNSSHSFVNSFGYTIRHMEKVRNMEEV